MAPLLSLLLTPLLLWVAPIQQKAKDVLYLAGGKTVRGKITAQRNQFTIVETDLGQLLIRTSRIQRVQRAAAAKKIEPQTAAKPPIAAPPAKPRAEVQPSPRRPAAAPVVQEARRGPLLRGRVIDRYPWLRHIGLSGKLVLLVLLGIAVWGVLLVGANLVGLDKMTNTRAAAIAVLWEILLVGFLLIPNPTLPVVAAAGCFLAASWACTGVWMLQASFAQTTLLGMLAVFAVSLVAVLVESI